MDPVGAQVPLGSLSGRVTRDSNGTGISNVRVDIYDLYWNFVKSAVTDASGNYTGSLPAGSYYLVTLNQQGYVDEYYNNVTRAGNAWPPAGVTSVNVVIGSDTPNINFGLSTGGSISGRVTRNSDGTGIPGVEVLVYDENWEHINSVLTDASGNYTIGGLPGNPAASYYLGTHNSQGYADEYYNNMLRAGSSWPPAGATAVSVVIGFDTPNINFGLTSGGSISGRVTRDSDGAGIPGVEVEVFDSQRNRLNSVLTDASGNYTVGGLVTGDYYVGTLNEQGYVDEYYHDSPRVASTWPPAGAAAGGGDDRFEYAEYPFWVVLGGVDFGACDEGSGRGGIPGVEIRVYSSGWGYVNSVFTDASGNYTAGGLTTGGYYLKTFNYLGYIDEYYDNASDSATAALVAVVAGSNTSNIHFSLAMSGSVSGRVVRDSNGTGIQGVQVNSVQRASGNPIRQGGTDSSGQLCDRGYPPGDVLCGDLESGRVHR